MTIIIEPYNSSWPEMFEAIKEQLRLAVSDLAIGIEHVGSTSVAGMWAKPVIDIDIIIESGELVSEITRRLAGIGYVHLGQLGIPDRDAYKAEEPLFRHNLYVCPNYSLALKNHLALREYLSKNPKARQRYSNLKRELAAKFPDDFDSYVEGKTAFITGILRSIGFSQADIDLISAINKAPNV